MFAQGVAALSLPLLTRLYEPQDFSVLAVYTSALGILAVVSCLRFNVALPLPASDREAANLLLLAVAAGVGCSLLVALAVLLAPQATTRVLGQPAIRPYLWMLPAGVLLVSAYDALQFWASRHRRFGLITKTRVTRAVGGSGTQLAMGIAAPGPLGLMLGQLVYSGLGFGGLAMSVWRCDRAAFKAVSIATLRQVAFRYRHFPCYSVPEALFNTAGAEVPVLIIAAAAAGPEAGFLMLAMRVMGLPMGLIGTSVGQVYLAEAPRKLKEGTLVRFTERTVWALFKLGAPPLTLAGAVSPFLFPFIFGAEWLRAGEIVAWLTPMFILQFVASPISLAPHVLGSVRWAMALQIVGGALRIGSVWAAAQLRPDALVEVYAIASALFYLLALIWTRGILRAGARHDPEH